MFSKVQKFLQNGTLLKTWFSSPQWQRLMGASLSGGAARIVTMLVAFATVPLALNYLGAERYGLWMAATSLVFILTSFADGGISNALITATAKVSPVEGMKGVRKTLASAAAIIIPIAALIILAGWLITPLISWQWVFNLPTQALASEARSIVLVVITSIALGFIVNLVLKTRTGLQQIPAVSAWDIMAALSILPALLLAIKLELSTPWLVAAIVGMPLLVKALGSILFLRRTPELVPHKGDADYTRARSLLGGGSVFFVIVLTQALAVQSDQVLIANLTGIEEVTTYSIVQRLFTIPYIFANFLFMAQWPAFSTAAARSDHDWIKRTFWRTLAGVVLLAITVTTLLFFLHKPILLLWVGDTIQPSFLLVIGMACYAVMLVIVGACSTLLVSLDVRRPQIWINIAMLLVNLPLSIYLIPKVGAAGAILGTAFSYFACMVVPYALIIPKILSKMSATQKKEKTQTQNSKTLENIK